MHDLGSPRCTECSRPVRQRKATRSSMAKASESIGASCQAVDCSVATPSAYGTGASARTA